MNTLVLRADMSGDPTFAELLGRVRAATDLAAFANADLPFERLVEVLNPQRSLSRHPLFQTMLTLQNTPRRALQPARGHRAAAHFDLGVAKFDLKSICTNCSTTRTPRPVSRRSPNTATDLFDHDTAVRLTERFGLLLDRLCDEPDLTIGAVDILTEAERTRCLRDWNDTGTEFGAGSLVEVIETVAAQGPDAAR